MEHKKDLTKLAFAALMLAASAPMNAQADQSQDVYLAALGCGSQATLGCGSQAVLKCGAKCGAIADNANAADPYNAKTNTYQAGNTYSSQPTSGGYRANTGSTATYGTDTSGSYGSRSSTGSYNPGPSERSYSGSTRTSSDPRMDRGYSATGGYSGTSGTYGGTNEAYNTSRTYNDTYYKSYNSNRTGPTSPNYVDSYRGTTYEVEVQGSPYPYGKEYGANTSLNREYNTTSDYDFNRAAVTTSTSSMTLTEAQLLSMLSPQGRAVYLSLDPEGKSLAIQLASQDSYRDKNLAVKEAQRRMNERRGNMSR